MFHDMFAFTICCRVIAETHTASSELQTVFFPVGPSAPHEGHPAKIETQNTNQPPKDRTGRREGGRSSTL